MDKGGEKPLWKIPETRPPDGRAHVRSEPRQGLIGLPQLLDPGLPPAQPGLFQPFPKVERSGENGHLGTGHRTPRTVFLIVRPDGRF